MAETQYNDKENKILGGLNARLNEFATCSVAEFSADQAMNVIEEAIGGSIASKNSRAAIVDFSTDEIDNLEIVVNRFDKNPPTLTDDADLELFSSLVTEARELMTIRREQIEKEDQYGGSTARINAQMTEAKASQQRLFFHGAHNQLNAAGEMHKRTKRVG